MTGKISRLPEAIRTQLNHRLANGQCADVILAWLNSLPEVKVVLDADFNGQPISDQNLSEYRKRGFRRWEMHQSAREFSSELLSAETAAPGQGCYKNPANPDPSSCTFHQRL